MAIYVSRVYLNVGQRAAVRNVGGRVLALQAQPVAHERARAVSVKPLRVHIAVRFVGVTKERSGAEQASDTGSEVSGRGGLRQRRFQGPSNRSEPVTPVVVRGKEYYHAKGLLA